MANVMSMKNVRNTVHRSAFDLSRKNMFTTHIGALTPCFVQEVLPGDSFNIDVSNFTRTSPVNTAAYVRLRENVDFFFVPYKLLWDKWEQFIVRTDDPHYAASASSAAGAFSSCPYINYGEFRDYLWNMRNSTSIEPNAALTAGNSSYQDGVERLLDLLGYGALVKDAHTGAVSNGSFSSLALNPFRLCAYQKIYQDHYRDSQWEPSKPQNYNFDYVFNDSQLKFSPWTLDAYALPEKDSSLKIMDNLFTLRYANYRKDKFLGIQPSPQFGDTAIAGPLIGNLGVSLAPSSSSSFSSVLVDGSPGYNFSNSGNTTLNRIMPLTALNNTSGISVLSLRLAEALQKYREITLTGSKDYKDQIFKHWNAKVPDYASTISERLFSYDSSVDISEVVNTNITQNADADIAGKGVSAGNGKFHWKNTSNQYGIIMGIYHCEPLLDYSGLISIPRQLISVTQDSYPVPEFDSLGMEEVRVSDFATPVIGVNADSVIGYAPRYYQWKTAVDEIHTGFLTSSAYGNWVSGFGVNNFFARIPGTKFTYLTKKVLPSLLNSIFVAQFDSNPVAQSQDGPVFSTDQLLVNMFINCKCARNLSADGLPY